MIDQAGIHMCLFITRGQDDAHVVAFMLYISKGYAKECLVLEKPHSKSSVVSTINY